MSLDEILRLQARMSDQTFGAKAQLARLNTVKRTTDKGARISTQLWECKRILSKVGLYGTVNLAKRLIDAKISRSPQWEEILEEAFREPVSFRDPTVWLLFQASLQAERDFALDVCPAHSREDVLTGRFMESIKGACAAWAEASASYLGRTANMLELSSIDLTVGGGEQETGADFALILDIRESEPMPPLDQELITLTGKSRGAAFIPLLFQAKCFTGESADISQKHKTRGYQFSRLRQTACASNYIFYENGEDGIDLPVLPMVKPASLCLPVEVSPKTLVFEKSINFSSYLLRAANGFDAIPAAETREDALNMILANISPLSVSKIAILGNTGGLDAVYRAALDQLRNEIYDELDLEPFNEAPTSEDESSNKFKPS
ncbi:hypothetical protein [Corallococcus exiguus]|uniref:hypothetical protein n=1 Tax=Corallococcus exiguus TaxID=83462 RepID=UPI003DA45877